MDEGGFTPTNPPIFGNINYDLMDQLLDEGCWLQTADNGYTFLQPDPSISLGLRYHPSDPLPRLEDGLSSYQQETETRSSSQNESQSHDQKSITPAVLKSFSWGGDELNRILWIAPKASNSTPVKERLMNAICHLREIYKHRDVLIQIWVPIKKGLKSFLTTVMQPHFCHPTSERLRFYRDVSEKYEFLADEDSKQAFGLPGRVFLGKAPEWTPNVRFFRDEEEYGRINYAHIYDVRGSIALPVFERGSGDCLGVVEVIMTTENFNYRPEVETVCKALQSVDLRSSKILNTWQEKVGKGSQEAVLLEILNVFRIVSDAHNLPLAQTWAPCSQQGKENGCWHSDKNALCVSMVDSACYIRDHRVLDFNRACSEHHLLRGRGGIVGKAFDTNQPCFITDVTEFSKVDYPLSHHAKMFGLRAAIAIRLCSIYHESRDYVLEFYLPSDNLQERGLTFHGRIWESVSIVIQQHCRNLHFIRVKEVEEQNLFPEKRTEVKELEMEPLTSEESQREETSLFSCIMNPKRKGKEMDISFGEEEPTKELNETHWSEPKLQLGQLYSDCRNIEQDSRSKDVVEDICGSSSGGQLPVSSRKAGEKRRTKAQKTISLEVLRQYFAGSLKDAARSMGVCPTTLKRICRQHGINRWPSRKIKKVGHSLKKLKVVIDSVQGSEGAINISSFYRDFPDLNSPNTQSRANPIFSMNLNNQPKQQQTKPEGSFLDSTSNFSNSSSSSQTSSHCFSGVAKLPPRITTAEDPGGSLKRAQSEAEIQELSKTDPNQLLERSQSHKYLASENPPSLPMSRTWPLRDAGVLFKAKATFGEEKVRFTISPSMGFQELQHEIAKRFNLEELTKINIKYLDDDSEWVLLTCDADLEECMYIYRLSGSHTIRLALSTISSTGGSAGSSGLC